MPLRSAVEEVAEALHHAAHLILPQRALQVRDLAAMRDWFQEDREAAAQGLKPYPVKTVFRPTKPSECEVYAMFAQVWGSTALGFGCIGGQAVTRAYTVVVQGPDGALAVYWSGRLAYLIDPLGITSEQKDAFFTDLANRRTVSQREAGLRYGAVFL